MMNVTSEKVTLKRDGKDTDAEKIVYRCEKCPVGLAAGTDHTFEGEIEVLLLNKTGTYELNGQKTKIGTEGAFKFSLIADKWDFENDKNKLVFIATVTETEKKTAALEFLMSDTGR